jgi:hypothetical protein
MCLYLKNTIPIISEESTPRRSKISKTKRRFKFNLQLGTDGLVPESATSEEIDPLASKLRAIKRPLKDIPITKLCTMVLDMKE